MRVEPPPSPRTFLLLHFDAPAFPHPRVNSCVYSTDLKRGRSLCNRLNKSRRCEERERAFTAWRVAGGRAAGRRRCPRHCRQHRR